MKTTLLSLVLTIGLVIQGCNNDIPHDIVDEIFMSVSSETGIMYDLFDSNKEYPIECMYVMTEENPGVWQPFEFTRIEGFRYERGHEYQLRVKRTTLANPPADAWNCSYSLISILEDRLIAAPEVPVDKKIQSEDDIEYQDLCPFEKYAITKELIVDNNGKIFYADGSSLPSYDAARIWIENILDKENPNWVKFQSVTYQATYSYVFSPLADEIRLIRNESSGPMFKNVIPENEFTHITQEMRSGEELKYSLILANVHKQALQKLEFSIRKQ